MSEKEILIAIAEYGGWTRSPFSQKWCSPQNLSLAKNGAYGVWVAIDMLPNYIKDLNACHEMEKMLTDLQYRKYCNLLNESGIDERGIGYPNWGYSATALQRAEAFLITVGKWEKTI